MKKIISILAVLLALLVLTSCTNDVSDPISAEQDSWVSIFQQYWEAMSLEYVHFSEETDLDWDAVYDKYLPLFKELDYSNENDSITAFKYFKEMSWRLRDYHYSLTVKDAFGAYIAISPSGLQKMKAAHPDWDVNDYPDVYKISGATGLITSVNRGYDNAFIDTSTHQATDEETAEYLKYVTTVEGKTEISELAKSGKLHGGKDDFGANYYTYSFKSASGTTEKDKAWNTVLEALSLSGFGYCFGLTSDGYFYYYLSSFPSSKCLEPLLYEEAKDLTDADKAKLQEEGLAELYALLWSPEYDFSTERDNLEGIVALVANLKSIAVNGTCTFDGTNFQPVKGVIMDVRGNGGGDSSFLFSVMGSFFSSEIKLGQVRYRDGYSRYNYTPWFDYYLEKDYCNADAQKNYDDPFVIIANGSSVSCAELACMYAKLLPNSKFVGGQTYGGTCGLSERTVFHSGPLNTDRLSIYTTTYQCLDSNGVNLETIGVTPDVKVDYVSGGNDVRYEKALETAKLMAK